MSNLSGDKVSWAMRRQHPGIPHARQTLRQNYLPPRLILSNFARTGGIMTKIILIRSRLFSILANTDFIMS